MTISDYAIIPENRKMQAKLSTITSRQVIEDTRNSNKLSKQASLSLLSSNVHINHNTGYQNSSIFKCKCLRQVKR